MAQRGNKKGKKSQEDRLSTLPNHILQYILSFIDTKSAVKTSALSTRWRYVWTLILDLKLDSEGFVKLTNFGKFVRGVLSRHAAPSISKLHFRRRNMVDLYLTNRVINYAVSHNVKDLNIELDSQSLRLPQAILKSKTLETLRLRAFILPKEVPFTGLTSLHLSLCSFLDKTDRVDPFTGCGNLKSLSLHDCEFRGMVIFKISARKLVHLTITGMTYEQIGSRDFQLEISTPMLATFSYKYSDVVDVSISEVPSLKEIDVHVFLPCDQDSGLENVSISYWNLTKMLERLHNAQSITLSDVTIKVLTCFPDLLEGQKSPFNKMKLLKVTCEQNSTIVSDEAINYLSSGSPDLAVVVFEYPKPEARDCFTCHSCYTTVFNFGRNPNKVTSFIVQNIPASLAMQRFSKMASSCSWLEA